MNAKGLASHGRLGKASGLSICSFGKLYRGIISVVIKRIYSIMFTFRKQRTVSFAEIKKRYIIYSTIKIRQVLFDLSGGG